MLYSKCLLAKVKAVKKKSKPESLLSCCGKGGIRTLGTVARTTVFETVPFNHSGIFPKRACKLLVSNKPAKETSGVGINRFSMDVYTTIAC
jgi:hypothetical protein